MTQRSPFLEEVLKRIRSGERTDYSKKRRRTSKILFVVDAFLIVIILLFFYNRNTDKLYHTTTFDYSRYSVRLSVTREHNEGDYLFSINLHSKSDKKITINFQKNAGTIQLKTGNTIIDTETFGENIDVIELKPDENQTYARIIDAGILNQYAREHPEALVPKKRSLIQFEKQHIPVKADITLNTSEPVTISLNFKHGVD